MGLLRLLSCQRFKLRADSLIFKWALRSQRHRSTNRRTKPINGTIFVYDRFVFLLAVNGHHLLLDGIFIVISSFRSSASFLSEMDKSQNKSFVYFKRCLSLRYKWPFPLSAVYFSGCSAWHCRTHRSSNEHFCYWIACKIIVSFVLFVIVFSSMFVVTKQLFEFTFTSMRGMMKLLGGA